MLKFLGEMSVTFFRLFRMKARFRAVDLFLLIQQCGAQALPIVTLISFLVGVILAFVGAVQLKQFGAQIYVADLVGIAIVHEMGAMMTGIIMAGRTGAAFAAQLGTMKVTQEIDAFTTMGFSPLEFLVLPRVIALVLMMPLLCLYADFVGVLGGATVAMGMLDLSWTTYVRETIHAVGLTDLFGGIFKSSVYGVLVALSGCLRGIQCGNSSSAVGDAATSAVVTGIVAIVVLAAFLPSSSTSWGFDVESNQKGQLTEISKLEIRNSKQIQMIKWEKIPNGFRFGFGLRILDLRFSFVSDFDLRISNFVKF